jgi:hypothetical protein
LTQNEIMKMAREAGLHIATDVNWMPIIGLEYAEKFAKLVAQHEREACAQMLEAASKTGKIISCTSAAEAIRARGQA